MKAQIKGLEDDPLVKGQQVGVWQWTNQFVGLQQVANRPLEMATAGSEPRAGACS